MIKRFNIIFFFAKSPVYTQKQQQQNQQKQHQNRENLLELIKLLPANEKRYHRILMHPEQHSKIQLEDLNGWIERVTNIYDAQLHNKTNIQTLLMTLSYTKYQKALSWKNWTLSLLGLRLYSNRNSSSSWNSKLSNIQHNEHQQQQENDKYQIEERLQQYIVVKISQIYQQQIAAQINKNKKSRIKLRFILYLTQNLQKVKSIDNLRAIMCNIAQSINQMQLAEKIRFSRVCKIVEQIFIEQYNGSTEFKQKMHATYNGSILLFNMLKLFNLSRYSINIQTQQLLARLVMRQTKMLWKQRNIRNFFTLFRYFPVSIHQSNNLRVYYKKQIWEWFTQKLDNKDFREVTKDYEPSYLELNTIYVIQIYFYEAYMKLKTKQVGNLLLIVEKATAPYISQIVWELYQVSASKMKLRNETLLHLYQKHYKNKSSLKICSKFVMDEHRHTIYDVSLDNEACFRISSALQQLNISYRRQIKIGGKMVDFVTEDNIIIECDGDAHIDYYRSQISVSTGYRNLIYMLQGYKVISISFLQINNVRGHSKLLLQILQNKLNAVRQEGVYCVA